MKPDTNLRDLAKKSLASINNKIGGFYEGFEFENERPVARAMSVENLVQLLISEATDSTNLVSYFPIGIFKHGKLITAREGCHVWWLGCLVLKEISPSRIIIIIVERSMNV